MSDDWNHSHQCPSCGTIWRHALNSPDYAAAHTCKCGTLQYYVHEFKDAAAAQAFDDNKYGRRRPAPKPRPPVRALEPRSPRVLDYGTFEVVIFS